MDTNARLSRRTALQAIALVGLLAGAPNAGARPADAPVQIMFVCEGGNRESVVAAFHVQRVADQMQFRVTTMARGVYPEGPVPAFVSEHLAESGFSLAGFRPALPTARELIETDYLIEIGTRSDFQAPGAIVMRWDDLPSLDRDWDGAWQIIIARGAKLLEHIAAARAQRPAALG